MKNDRVTNKICVRLCDLDGNFKASYYTSNFQDTLAMYKYMSEENISLFHRANVGEDNEKEFECNIEDVSVNFGDKDNLLSIDLYCEILDWS